MQRERYGSFKRPPSQEAFTDDESAQRQVKRRPTVYDAVAGRAFENNLLSSNDQTRLPPNASKQPLRPDEILFKARNAPTRYEESDHYFAHAQLPPDRKLPSEDLLRALHVYISNFYARSQEQVEEKVWKSMDETALIALGILMEESAKEVLGDTGDLVFLEGADDSEEMEERAESKTMENTPNTDDSESELPSGDSESSETLGSETGSE